MDQGKLVKIWIASAVLFFVIESIFHYLRQGLIAHNEILAWHAADAHDFIVYAVTVILGSCAFAYIFLQGYKGRGWMEGVRYGIWVTLLASVFEVGAFAGQLTMGRRIPVSFVVGDLVTFIICGAVAAAIAGGAPATSRSSSAAA